MVSKEVLRYYATQGTTSDPERYTNLYDDLPSEPEQLVMAMQGLLIHIFHAHRHGVELSEERKREIQIRRVVDMAEQIVRLDERPLLVAREPDRRLVANCRGYSVLICSLLRHKGIPARARCGFGTYFTPGRYEDHWTAEYWSSDEHRWVRIDPQVDSLQKEAFRLEFDHLDMPPGRFLPAGEVWKLCREGKVDPDLCGIFDLKGLWFVKDNLLRDFMALNKLEVLPWDRNEWMKKSKEPTEEQYALLDRIAELTTGVDNSFSEMRALWKSNRDLGIDADWTP
jgi:hypothetical protein